MSMGMNSNDLSVLLTGGHDTGKSIYIARLWLALRRANGLLAMPEDPEEIEYVESLIRILMKGEYPERTDNDGQARDFRGTVAIRAGEFEGSTAEIIVPDVAGELWENASEGRDLENKWVERIRSCTGALLFLRLGSKHHVNALDWITSADKMKLKFIRDAHKDGVATQVFLTDLLNILDLHLGKDTDRNRPRVAIMIAAWDALSEDSRSLGPRAYIDMQYPLFGGRLRDDDRLETRVFASSVSGGDLNTEAHRTAFLGSNADQEGYIVYETGDGLAVQSPDLTLPVAWALGCELS